MASSSAVSSVAPSSAAASSSVPQVQLNPLLHRIDEFDELQAENELLLERIERRQGIIDEFSGDEPEMEWLPFESDEQEEEVLNVWLFNGSDGSADNVVPDHNFEQVHELVDIFGDNDQGQDNDPIFDFSAGEATLFDEDYDAGNNDVFQEPISHPA